MFIFSFISWEASCLFEILISCSRSKLQNPSAGYFFCLQFGLRICTEGPNSSSLISCSRSELQNPFTGYFFCLQFGPRICTEGPNSSSLISCSRSKLQNPFTGYFFCLQFGPQICTEGLNSSSQQIEGGSFLVPYCLGLLLPFPLWTNQVLYMVYLIFS